ncbi:MAG TPA: DMT family transporter, partial [Terricaulis sp.]|nr:DMT family transporter [Terricaulis sp.]
MDTPAVERAAYVRVYAMLMLVMLFWAGNSIVGRAVHQEIAPFTLALARWAGALLVLAPFAWKHVRADWPMARKHWRVILLLGVLGVAAFNALLYSGLAYTTATNSVLIQAGIPALVLLLGLILYRERPAPAQVIGVTIAAVGAAVIVARGDLSVLTALRFGYGDVLIVIAALIWAFYTVLLRARPPIHPLSFLLLTFAIGVIAMAPLAA